MADELSVEQQQKIRDLIATNPDATLSEIASCAFDNAEIDSRSREGRMVKQFLVNNKLEYKNRSVFQRERVTLTDEHKEFIKNNYKTQHYVEIAKILFKNDNLTPVTLECRAVNSHIVELQKADPEYFEQNTFVPPGETPATADPAAPVGLYYPPRRTDQTVYRINKYLNLGWDASNLKVNQQKQVDMLQRYLNIYSLSHQINTYKTLNDRNLFEDAFIRYTYDKEDLSQEEMDQFIVLCTEHVTASSILAQVEDLRDMLRNSSAEMDQGGRNIKMTLTEAITSLQTEYNQCRTRQNKLYKSLVDDRAQRVKMRKEENATILNLVKAWKDQERREGMIMLAEAQKENLKDEAKRLSSMDELKGIIRGISEDEMVNG